MSVLLIDDCRDPCDILSSIYPKKTFEGLDITICRDAESGIAELKKKIWEVVLLDHDMGDRSGMHVIWFLYEKPQFMPKSIYLVSANPIAGARMMENLEKMWEEGMLPVFGWLRGS